jgi:hypothetical protein
MIRRLIKRYQAWLDRAPEDKFSQLIRESYTPRESKRYGRSFMKRERYRRRQQKRMR